MAAHWVERGASRLHVVDLDGAKTGSAVNLPIVQEIAGSAPVPVQYGGGVRDVELARSAVSRGIDRVIVGTAAVEEPGLVERLVRELGGESLVVSVDARDGRAALQGWTRESGVAAVELAQRLEAAGVERIVYTGHIAGRHPDRAELPRCRGRWPPP